MRVAAHDEGEIRRIVTLAAGRDEGQIAREDLPLPGRAPPADAPREVREAELGELVREPGLDVRELEVGHDLARLAFRKLEPDAQRALAAGDLRRQRQPFAPRGDVGVVEPHEQAAFRLLPVLQRRGREIAAQVQRGGELGRRRAFEPETMAAEPALQAQLDAIEDELRGIALIVVPGDQRVADHDLRLVQDPLGEPQIVGRLRRIDLDSRHVQDAGAVAPDREPWAVDDELLQAQLEQGQRRPRDDEPHFRKLEQRRRAGEPRSCTRKPSMTNFGFHPSQPAVNAAISTGCPSCCASMDASRSR